MTPIQFSAAQNAAQHTVVTAANILQMQAANGNKRAKALQSAQKNLHTAQALFDRMMERRRQGLVHVSQDEFNRVSGRLQDAKDAVMRAQRTKA